MSRLTLLLLLAALSPGTLRAEAPLRVGFSARDLTPKLTPERPVYLAGFGTNRKATAVHDPIMVRAIVLEHDGQKVAMACVDVVGLFYDVAQAVRGDLPGFRYVLVSSTHNHEGPDTVGLWGASPFSSGVDPEYLKQLREGIAAAIRDAEKDLRPTRVRYAALAAPELLKDNREPYVLHDELAVLRFEPLEGDRPLGLLVQWHCHPETLAEKNTQISADFVASTVEQLAKTHRCPVAYFTGTVGGLLTSLKVDVRGPKGELLKDGTFEKTAAYGKLVADRVDLALRKSAPITLTPFTVKTQPLLMPMENKLYQLGWQLGVLKRTAYLWGDDPYSPQRVVAKDASKPIALETELGYLQLGELEIAVIPGEIYPELVLGQVQDPADPGADFPDAPREPSIWGALKSNKRMLIGLGNDELGYFIPRRQWDEVAPFCYGRKSSQYGEVNSIGPRAAPIICEGFRKLVTGK